MGIKGPNDSVGGLKVPNDEGAGTKSTYDDGGGLEVPNDNGPGPLTLNDSGNISNLTNSCSDEYRQKLRSYKKLDVEVCEQIRDISLINIIEDIRDLVCIMKSYISHTKEFAVDEIALPEHKSMCVITNVLERFNQDLNGKQKCNFPCYPETIDAMFALFTKLGSSPFKRLAAIFYMPSVDSMRILLR